MSYKATNKTRVQRPVFYKENRDLTETNAENVYTRLSAKLGRGTNMPNNTSTKNKYGIRMEGRSNNYEGYHNLADDGDFANDNFGTTDEARRRTNSTRNKQNISEMSISDNDDSGDENEAADNNYEFGNDPELEDNYHDIHDRNYERDDSSKVMYYIFGVIAALALVITVAILFCENKCTDAVKKPEPVHQQHHEVVRHNNSDDGGCCAITTVVTIGVVVAAVLIPVLCCETTCCGCGCGGYDKDGKKSCCGSYNKDGEKNTSCKSGSDGSGSSCSSCGSSSHHHHDGNDQTCEEWRNSGLSGTVCGPDDKELNGECDGPHCTYSECCAPKSGPGGGYVGSTNCAEWLTHKDEGGYCPVTHQVNWTTKPCSEYPDARSDGKCTRAQCCHTPVTPDTHQTCGEYNGETCGANEVDQATTFTCSTDTCTKAECCKPKTGGKCGATFFNNQDNKCDANQTKRANDVICDDTTCTQSECCMAKDVTSTRAKSGSSLLQGALEHAHNFEDP